MVFRNRLEWISLWIKLRAVPPTDCARYFVAESLRELLPGIEFGKVNGTNQVISVKAKIKQMYDQREKEKLGQQSLISSA